MSTSMFKQFSLITTDSKGEPQTLSKTGVVLAAVCLAVVPLDISQLVFALIGAFAYAVITQWQQQSDSKKKRLGNGKSFGAVKHSAHGRAETIPRDKMRAHSSYRDGANQSPVVPRQEETKSKLAHQPSAAPIAAPVFKATGWDAEVEELLAQISPTSESEQAVQHLAYHVQQLIQPLLPQVKVVGFASSNFSRGTAFGVAVPEVDLVACLDPDALVKRFLVRNGQSIASASVDMHKLQKTAVRLFTDKLVASDGFKFRRSAFRGREPKVTMLAPMMIGSSEVAIPVDFTVNSTTQFSSAALLAECALLEPRATSLVLLVRRWAKDRGICHVAKGHFSPYAWSLLAIFFLQTRATSDEPLLPPLGKSGGARKSSIHGDGSDVKLSSVGHLFQEFIAFYATDFDWRNEAVSVRLGRRGPPELSLPLHIVLDDAAGTTAAGPSIEDPFDIGQNLGDSMNSCSLARLQEELSRAQMLCSQNASLTELLQPWEPERAADSGLKDGEEQKDDDSDAKTQTKPSPQSFQCLEVDRWAALRSPQNHNVTRANASSQAKIPPWRSGRTPVIAKQ